jgi:hypothetical protein
VLNRRIYKILTGSFVMPSGIVVIPHRLQVHVLIENARLMSMSL